METSFVVRIKDKKGGISQIGRAKKTEAKAMDFIICLKNNPLYKGCSYSVDKISIETIYTE